MALALLAPRLHKADAIDRSGSIDDESAEI
jgi:hypothetical protein